MTIYIILGICIPIILILLYGVWNLLRKLNAMEDLIIDTVKETKEHVQNALLVMQHSDINGSFESDDEVGVAFKDIKTAIDELNEKF